jgi:LysM repeat protein
MKQNDIENLDRLTPQQLENLFNVFTDDDDCEIYYYNLLRTVNFPEDLDESLFTTYKVRPQDTYPMIAHRIYGSLQLWWLICAINNIKNPLPLPEPGIELKVLSSNVVKTILGEIRSS